MTSNEQPLGIGMIGCGTVGGGVAELLRDQADLYSARLGRPVQLKSVLVRDASRVRSDAVPSGVVTTDADTFFATPDMPIVLEVAGGTGAISQLVRRSLEAGKHVVTANKALLAVEGPDLFTLARQHNACIAFEASCGGGMPIITSLLFGMMANRIDALFGILNGTCNYILTEMTQKGKTYNEALTEAKELGFAEADPTLDVSGMDASQKLAVLASLAFGVSATESDVHCHGIDDLELDDIRFGAELGYDIKLLAIAERLNANKLSLRTQPCFIHKNEQLARVDGSFNALSVYGHATGHVMTYGRGAGKLPTASAVVSDLLNVASGWYPRACEDLHLLADRHDQVELVNPDDLEGRYYLRVNALDVPGVMASVSTILGDSGISLGALLQHESNVGEFVPVVIVTHQAKQGAVREALKTIESLDVIAGKPVFIRIVDLPKG